MDSTDRKLLDLLQRDASLSLDELGERAALSRNACWRRVKRLEDDGIIKARVTLLRDIGAAMSPFNAFMFIQGLETLPLRIRAHCENAIKVAEHLSKNPKITKVSCRHSRTTSAR